MVLLGSKVVGVNAHYFLTHTEKLLAVRLMASSVVVRGGLNRLVQFPEVRFPNRLQGTSSSSLRRRVSSLKNEGATLFKLMDTP